MIDNLALGLTHGLLILAAWRLLTRPDLDDAAASPPPVREERKPGWPVAEGSRDA
ncbi:MAG TPA: hypothetical protein VEZ48_06710 [Sphingomonadaceae bacterium]|jgi:hypothetical protein|nr:hypothetical protein [Sphingomonadaceae bacterium]